MFSLKEIFDKNPHEYLFACLKCGSTNKLFTLAPSYCPRCEHTLPYLYNKIRESIFVRMKYYLEGF